MITANRISMGDRPVAAKGNSGKVDWYTPGEYVSLARAVMGNIDLDPASCEKANTIVQAGRIYTVDDDGLSQPWNGRVWLNPPYAQGVVDRFIDKCIIEKQAKRMTQAVVLVNNATDTKWFQRFAKAADMVCLKQGRIAFLNNDTLEPQTGTAQGQAFLYFGNRKQTFRNVFQSVGCVLEVR